MCLNDSHLILQESYAKRWCYLVHVETQAARGAGAIWEEPLHGVVAAGVGAQTCWPWAPAERFVAGKMAWLRVDDYVDGESG